MIAVPIHILDGLPFVAATIHANGGMRQLQHVLLDTGSSGTMFSTDDLEALGIHLLPSDRPRFVRGIGGTEPVIQKWLEILQVGPLVVAHFEIEMGGMDYGMEINGILGLDFLLRTQAIIDLHALELRAPG